MDCDIQNSGCHGGNQANGFSYVLDNKGLDTEKEYNYDGASDPCWTAAEKRIAASIDSSSSVPASNETALAAAVAGVPVSVSVQATTAFRNYKTGTFTGAPSCGKTVDSLDHAVLVVGYTADHWIVKNSCAHCNTDTPPTSLPPLLACACLCNERALTGDGAASCRGGQFRQQGLHQHEAWAGGGRPSGHLRHRERPLLCDQGQGQPTPAAAPNPGRKAGAAVQLLALLPFDVREGVCVGQNHLPISVCATVPQPDCSNPASSWPTARAQCSSTLDITRVYCPCNTGRAELLRRRAGGLQLLHLPELRRQAQPGRLLQMRRLHPRLPAVYER